MRVLLILGFVLNIGFVTEVKAGTEGKLFEGAKTYELLVENETVAPCDISNNAAKSAGKFPLSYSSLEAVTEDIVFPDLWITINTSSLKLDNRESCIYSYAVVVRIAPGETSIPYNDKKIFKLIPIFAITSYGIVPTNEFKTTMKENIEELFKVFVTDFNEDNK